MPLLNSILPQGDTTPPSPDTRYPGAPSCIAIGAAMLVYAVVAIGTWGPAYIDFGDGQYMYVSRRVADGLTLYRDVLSPQPPVHTLIGSRLLLLADALGLSSPHFAIRAYSLALHLATTLLLVFLARRLACQEGIEDAGTLDAIGIATTLIYLTIPLGFWWTFGYQTHPTLMFLFMASLILLLRDTRWSVAAAGLIAALTLLTSMTSVPYVFFTLLWLLIRRPSRFLPFALPLVGFYAAAAAWFQWRTDGYFLDNVVFNQVGSFPKEEITGEPLWRYAARKITTQGAKIIGLEAGYLLAGGAGLCAWALAAWKRRWRYTDFVVCYTLGFWGSIVFTSKGATVDYIFTLGEPLVCVFAGIFLGTLALPAYRVFRSPGKRNATTRFAIAFMGVLILAAGFRAALFHRAVLDERLWELDSPGVIEVSNVIARYTDPGDPILAPPFYAFITGRTVAGEYAEIFLWTIKYYNENMLAENRGKPPGDGTLKVRELAGMLERHEIPLVILDMNQTGRLPEIRDALDRYYQPLGEPFSTANTPLQYYLPNDDN